jgi:hypothetical protein
MNTLALFYCFAWLIRKAKRVQFPFLTALGHYSLQVYTYHLVVVIILYPAIWRLIPFHNLLQVVVSLFFAASLYLPVLFIKWRQGK